jgi:hypothetical protein
VSNSAARSSGCCWSVATSTIAWLTTIEAIHAAGISTRMKMMRRLSPAAGLRRPFSRRSTKR